MSKHDIKNHDSTNRRVPVDAQLDGARYRIATLGDERTRLTCSLAIAEHHFPSATLVGANSFEAAALEMFAGRADAFLVPAAYPGLPAFLMDDRCVLRDVFREPIPQLVLVALQPNSKNAEVLFHHPATTSLLSKIPFPVRHAVHAESNETAVADMFAAGGNAAAITNALVASRSELACLMILRPASPMGWLLFDLDTQNPQRTI
jgi:hypothetical protein